MADIQISKIEIQNYSWHLKIQNCGWKQTQYGSWHLKSKMANAYEQIQYKYGCNLLNLNVLLFYHF